MLGTFETPLFKNDDLVSKKRRPSCVCECLLRIDDDEE